MAGQGDQIAKLLKQNIEESVGEAVAQCHADLVMWSPVDTGRFRASWFHVEGPGADTDAVAAETPGGGKVPAPPALDPSTIKGTSDQRIINNLPYATRLCEDGWSTKADPAGFKQIAQRFETGQYLDAALKRRGLA